MDDKQAMHAMSIDDAYHVERTLARGPSGVTELVSIDGNGPFVRKKIPSPLAQRNVWAEMCIRDMASPTVRPKDAVRITSSDSGWYQGLIRE